MFPQLPGVKKLTDLYLLGLAISKSGVLAAWDEKIDAPLVTGGRQRLMLVP